MYKLEIFTYLFIHYYVQTCHGKLMICYYNNDTAYRLSK